MKNEKISTQDNILPWIKDGSYQSAEYQLKIKKLVEQIRGPKIPDGVTWYPNGRAVI